MARATTRTRTWTSTYTRTQLLAFNINYVVRATTGSTTFERIVEEGVIRNQWIKVIDVYGLDGRGDVHAHIIMTIDWEQHKLHIEADRNAIPIDERLPEGERLDFVIGNIVKFFNKVVEEERLSTKWMIEYESGVDSSRANKELYVVNASKPKWGKGEVHHVKKVYPEKLDEFSVSFSLLVPEGRPEERVQRRRGTVKWFDEQKGYGFIVPEEKGKDIFVHYSDIIGDSWRTLTEGQTVEFDVEKTIKGLEAVNVKVIR